MPKDHSAQAANPEAPLVSYVTPFYNTGEYLGECIESVLRQTYGNWEYVLLNNCSTDNSVQIAEHYSREYPDRIRLEHNSEFLSQVQNFNRVFRFISPESRYCKFVQADDWLFSDCVSRMIEVAEADPSVGIVGAYQLEGNEISLDGLPYPSPVLPGREVCRLYFLQGTYLFGTPTSLLLRSELVRSRDPFYEERYAPFEDGHACFDLMRNWNYSFVHQVLTFSRRQNDSILERLRPFSFDLLLRFSMLVAHGKDFLSEQEYDRCLSAAKRRYFRYLARSACAFNGNNKEFWEFHRAGLASVNYPLGWRLLAKWVPRALIEKSWDTFWAKWDKDSGSN